MYVIKRTYDNYTNLEIENFDPSLVPVSSIVTLAKVAQKLVDGGGTLTNPGNLKITGNQEINGNQDVNGYVSTGSHYQFKGRDNTNGFSWYAQNSDEAKLWSNISNSDVLKVNKNGDSTITKDLYVNGNTTVNGKINNLGIYHTMSSPTWNKIQYGDGTGWAVRFEKNGAEPASPFVNIYDNGKIETTNNITAGNNTTLSAGTNTLTVNGQSTFNGQMNINANQWHKSSDGKNRFFYGNNDRTYFGSGNGYEFRNSDDGYIAQITNDNKFCIGNTCIDEGLLANLKEFTNTGRNLLDEINFLSITSAARGDYAPWMRYIYQGKIVNYTQCVDHPDIYNWAGVGNFDDQTGDAGLNNTRYTLCKKFFTVADYNAGDTVDKRRQFYKSYIF